MVMQVTPSISISTSFPITRKSLLNKVSNIEFRGDQCLKPGSPETAKARSAVIKNLDVLVGREFRPGLFNLLKQFVCVMIRVDAISKAIEVMGNNLDRIRQKKTKGEDRKHSVLSP
jgi:hypothetical protein